MNLSALLELVRAPAALSVPGDVVAGAAAANLVDRRTAGLACSSVCLYWAGMAANDWADRALDAVERPERPIPSGRISPPAALGVAAGLTAAGLVAAGLGGGRRSLGVATALAAAVWFYDLRLKNTAAGPAGMAACRALDVLLGASRGRMARAVPAAATVAVHTWTVTELSRREVSGARPGLAAATMAVTAALTGVVAAQRQSSGPVVAGLAATYAWRYGRAQAAVFTDPAAGTVRKAVGAGITSLPALQGALAARAGAPWAGVAVASAAPVASALVRKVSAT
ncbi:SCO3242 family prenyltransferase [Jidongwangia harbinensis]|uniref:SCO3242 family prenyltransferase n=1 Tax=Jidongwangia harbinensis TaxID=2878561 RepID=UPI001CDA212D|nr:UbiA family prenyltransferase [Jidongwangia harbinensis]MCA2214349.1 UbiA family prenyltransferase [Jidongwangia harbinensis]